MSPTGADVENIRRACLLISRSNGGINRYRPEAKVLRELQQFIDSRPYHDELRPIDHWLGTLTASDLETVCDGDQDEAETITKAAPAFTETLLNEWFDAC